MKTNYTGWEYLCIDVANQMDMDKELFEDRIQWTMNNINELESLVSNVKPKLVPLYLKAVQAIRKAQAGKPTGHMVALDATCSGIQIMSAITGCVTGATNTNLVDPTARKDAYGILRVTMEDRLEGDVDVDRDDSKNALMTMMYGSKAQPKKIFGEDTDELEAFYKAAHDIAPGACSVLQALVAAWQPYALVHEWKLPDGFTARVKVMQQKDARIEVDELNHSSFTYQFYENEGKKKGISLAANVVHSIDAYVLRSMHRRCNYDADVVLGAELALEGVLHNTKHYQPVKPEEGTKLDYYIKQWERSGMADVVILPYLNSTTVRHLPLEMIRKLYDIVVTMLQHKPFPLVTVHDAFAAHANNLNHVRQHYINIFAELAESNILQDILSQLHGRKGQITKLSNNLGELIRGSAYALS